jgi:ABC-2 type transport system ATP-binding protein
LNDETIFIADSHAIECPDEIARIMVHAGIPPTRLAIEQQDLEDHFLQLTGGAK